MDSTYAEPLDIARLAAIAFTSEAHFIRTFKETFGETPHRYLQRRRVEQLVEEDRTGREDRSKQIWQLLTLELWCRQTRAHGVRG